MGTAGLAGCARRGGSRTTQTGDGRVADGGGPTASGQANTRVDHSTPDTPPTGGGEGLPVRLQTVAEGFTSPIDFAETNEGTQFVADQKGLIYRLDSDGPSIFLDLVDQVVAGGERGLLGLALHPDYLDNRRFFVRYSSPRRAGTPSGFSHTFVLSEFLASDNGLRADPTTERTLLEIPQPQSNHNAGAITFGPDGTLFIGVGDGGAANDSGRGHVDDWYGVVPGGNGQDVTDNLLGSILRIDVDHRADGRPYGIPDDNPLVDAPGLDEHFAWGLRNPWRMSFHGEEFFVADVGQNSYEEINLVEAGGNYGWNVKEGANCFRNVSCPSEAPGGEPLIDPIIQYPHTGNPVSGIAVIGGYVYEGSTIPALQDRYVFADWRANGRLFVATRSEDAGHWPSEVLEVASADRDKLAFVLSFGRGADGELFVLTARERSVSGQSGVMYRLKPSS